MINCVDCHFEYHVPFAVPDNKNVLFWALGSIPFYIAGGVNFMRGNRKAAVIHLSAAICCHARSIFELYKISVRY